MVSPSPNLEFDRCRFAPKLLTLMNFGGFELIGFSYEELLSFLAPSCAWEALLLANMFELPNNERKACGGSRCWCGLDLEFEEN